MSKSRGEHTKSQERARVSHFARRLLAEWRQHEPPGAGCSVIIGVSGGADSMALWLACDELIKAEYVQAELVVAHLDHGLRAEAGERDARWVEELARGLGVECVVGRVAVSERAKETGDNLEQAARRARYEFLRQTARAREAHTVLVAHTSDDQAETVLLRLMRGSGAEGLSGMRVRRLLDEREADLWLMRPLVRWARRVQTENYCQARGVAFRQDAMNEDENFARVRVRRRLLPLLETFNPRVVEALARTAELLRDDDDALTAQAARLLGEATEIDLTRIKSALNSKAVKTEAWLEARLHMSPGPLRVEVLALAPVAVRRRALREWVKLGRGDLRRVELVHLHAIEKLLEGQRGGRRAPLPGGCFAERRRGWLFFHRS